MQIAGALFVLFAAALFLMLFLMTRKEHARLRAAWTKMSSFESFCLQAGAILQLALPMLSQPPFSGNYVGEVAASLIDVVTSGLFMIGVLAFLQHLHTNQNEPQSNAPIPPE